MNGGSKVISFDNALNLILRMESKIIGKIGIAQGERISKIFSLCEFSVITSRSNDYDSSHHDVPSVLFGCWRWRRCNSRARHGLFDLSDHKVRQYF